MSRQSRTVLIVDDDEALVDRYEEWLADSYDVETVTDGADPLADLEEVDVALLDRTLPTPSGDAIATDVDRRDADCMTAIVSEAKPDTGIVHVSCGEYLRKPVTETKLTETVDRLRQRARYDDHLAECADLAERLGTLEASRSPRELEDDDEYHRLRRRLDELHEDLDELCREFDAEDFRAAFATPDFAGGARIQQVAWI